MTARQETDSTTRRCGPRSDRWCACESRQGLAQQLTGGNGNTERQHTVRYCGTSCCEAKTSCKLGEQAWPLLILNQTTREQLDDLSECARGKFEVTALTRAWHTKMHRPSNVIKLGESNSESLLACKSLPEAHTERLRYSKI